MTHRSRLSGLMIDCRTEDLEAAAGFWSAALGDRRRHAREGDYVPLDHQGGLYAAVQQVEHPSRMHVDIETDDVAAEMARIERLGGRRIRQVRDWVVMEAPTGQRFCVTPAHSADFDATATRWPDPEETRA